MNLDKGLFLDINSKEVRQERTGWRDKKLDELLKTNHIEQPNSFLVTEYNYGKSVAMIEYKHISESHEINPVLLNYCNGRLNQEYYFIVLFDYEKKNEKYKMNYFCIYPGNSNAVHFIEKYYKITVPCLNEQEYIKFLYQIRNNVSSPYYQKAMETYEEWFDFEPYHSSSSEISASDISKSLISQRHRTYAYDVPAADIDCIVYSKKNNPYLFIEYKANHNYGRPIDRGHNHFIHVNVDQETRSLSKEGNKRLWNKALIDLGDNCKNKIPVILVEYNLEHNIFSIYAMNQTAKEIVRLVDMKQDEYFKYIKDPSNFINKKCPLCGHKLELKKGIYGKFYGCSGFKVNHCRYTEQLD